VRWGEGRTLPTAARLSRSVEGPIACCLLARIPDNSSRTLKRNACARHHTQAHPNDGERRARKQQCANAAARTLPPSALSSCVPVASELWPIFSTCCLHWFDEAQGDVEARIQQAQLLCRPFWKRQRTWNAAITTDSSVTNPSTSLMSRCILSLLDRGWVG